MKTGWCTEYISFVDKLSCILMIYNNSIGMKHTHVFETEIQYITLSISMLNILKCS